MSRCRYPWAPCLFVAIAVLAGGDLVRAQAVAGNVAWIKPAISSTPSGRCCAAIAFDWKQGATLFFGGFTPYITYNDTWIWRNGWRQLAPVNSPSPRDGQAMVWDAAAGNIVLFGGIDSAGNLLNDTWTWDGTNWSEQFPAISPPGRQFEGQGMTYDDATGNVVLFGGLAVTSYLGDTWTWNGIAKTWTRHFPARSPSARRTMLAYDYVTRKVVLFGGDDTNGSLGETWTWDGLTWTQHFPASSPSPRGLFSFAWDSNLGVVVLFGGNSGPGQNLGDTWTWNGANWTEVTPVSVPPGRFAAPMYYDYVTNGLLLFGGFSTGTLDDTWLLLRIAEQ